VTLRHIVLFRVREEVDDERLDDLMAALGAFAMFPGVTSWIVARSLDERKGRIVIEDATFKSPEAFEGFRADTAHARVAQMMSEISDWWVGDYLTDADQ
jgi:hypothetical protein